MSGIILVAHIAAKEEHRENLLSFFEKTLIPQSRAEEGNNQYDLLVDADNPCAFTMLENWKDDAAIKLHNNSKHFKDFVALIDGKITDLKIHKLLKKI